MPCCRTHPDRPMLAPCTRCGRAFCEECLLSEAGPPICVECSIAAASGMVQRKVREDRARESVAPVARAARRRTWLQVVIAACLVIAAGEIAAIFFLGSTPENLASTADAAVPERATLAQAAAEALLIQAGLEAFRRQTGSYPENLATIIRQLPPPISGRIRLDGIEYAREGKDHYRLRISTAAAPIVLEPASKRPLFAEAQR